MLVEKSRSTEVVGEVITDNYTYGVNYSLNGSGLARLNCSVTKKVVSEVETPGGKQDVENLQHVGSMNIEGSNRNVYMSGDEVITPHAAVFEQILAEVKASIAPILVAAKSSK